MSKVFNTLDALNEPDCQDTAWAARKNSSLLTPQNLSGIIGVTGEALCVNNDGAGRGILSLPPSHA